MHVLPEVQLHELLAIAICSVHEFHQRKVELQGRKGKALDTTDPGGNVFGVQPSIEEGADCVLRQAGGHGTLEVFQTGAEGVRFGR